ncbi:hypothetical protein BW723_12230 [Polaribacter reichenbachii]|uniref:Uncharacterized protein n=1 Tax=Polaribacter reichenbachii TaxID=996801 RepID=A0A1B8TPA8_9FLAO|nr:DUF5694 domain-containing protein [Polaribacter reichenbachii]APZ47004.1 hypothetical protein BW723_12230 [Polaribacter reichenbachii]AUC17647.1 hypothetical protein BTO17_02680 [Polaribacter reichenbachii]OBY61480.1 hypothetical protein LPB301_15545 [Polaribacter reichenbachii]
MKTQITLISLIFISIFNLSAQEELQEIIIIGTMHKVPKIVKNSYKPMLRFAKKYNPEAIYVESPMANDSISWNYLKEGWSKNYKQFYKLSNDLKDTFQFNADKFKILSNKNLKVLNVNEINELIINYAHKRDNGNYGLLTYFKKYGSKGAKKPTRHEDGDLTYKLAIHQNLKVTNMDDQQTNGLYHKAWGKCSKEGVNNGNNNKNSKLNKKDYNSAILPAIFRGLGKHVNKRKSLNRLHKMSSFNYVLEDTEGCKEGRKYWNERNMRMAKNIAEQVLTSNKKRNLVIVGAAHVIGLEKELKTNYPNLKVILMNEY